MAGRILVVGATGFAGRGAVAELEARGARFAAATRDADRARRLLGDRAPLVLLDVDSEPAPGKEAPARLARAFEGFDALLLIPPETGGERKRELAAVIAGAAASAGIRRFATVSGLSAMRDAASISRRVECDVEALGVAWTHLRPNFFMQNHEGAHLAEVRRGALETFTGSGRTSLVDARDVGAAAAAVLLEPGYEGLAPILTGPEALDQTEIAATLSRALGRRIEATAKSHDDTRAALRAASLSERAVEASVARYAEVEAGAFAAISTELGEILGRPPRTFEAYVRDRAEVWRPS